MGPEEEGGVILEDTTSIKVEIFHSQDKDDHLEELNC